MKHVIHILSYHNGVPLALALLAVTGSAFAATTPDMLPVASVATSTAEHVSTDALLAYDPDTFSLDMRVTGVTEGTDAYVVTYTFHTLAIEDGVWTETQHEETLEVPKALLGGTTLEAYVQEELRERAAREQDFLARAKAMELARADRERMRTIPGLNGLVQLTDRLLPPRPGIQVVEGDTERLPIEDPAIQEPEPQQDGEELVPEEEPAPEVPVQPEPSEETQTPDPVPTEPTPTEEVQEPSAPVQEPVPAS